MSDRKPLMPKATAVWLVDNTALTFEQIAEFCGLHVLEVKGIADGDVAQGIKGSDPISSGQLTRDEIKAGEGDSGHKLKLAEPKVTIPKVSTKKRGPRYTPVSRRQDRPNAVVWLLRNHPELKDSQIMRLVGTTKPTITQIRDRTHWNTANLVPQDPVTLGLCSQTDLDAEVQKAAKRAAKERKATEPALDKAGSLLPTAETTDYAVPAGGLSDGLPDEEAPSREDVEREEEARVFAKLSELKSDEEEGAEAASEETPTESTAEADDSSSEPASKEAADASTSDGADDTSRGT